MNKPNIRFQDGQWLDADRLNKAMEAVDAAVDATNAAEASAAGANTSAAQSAQSANTARQDADASAQNLAAIKTYVDGNQTVGEQGANIAILQQRADKLEKHLGVYTRVSTLPLTANYATGKMLTTLADGKTVVLTDMPGWGVTRIFPLSEEHPEGFTFGDTAFLPMLSDEGENLMQVGAVVFASELVRTDEKGQVVYTELRSLYRAQTKDICEWGGLLKDISLRGRQLLVSHPLSVTLIDIGRSGRGASAATTEANIMDAMDEKANFAGRFPFFVAGQATALEKTEAGVEDLAERLTARPVGFAPDLMHDFGSLDTRGAWDDADDLYLSVKKVTGDVVGGNQMCKYDSLRNSSDNLTITYKGNGHILLNGTSNKQYISLSGYQSNFVKGHRYIGVGDFSQLPQNAKFELFDNGNSPRLFTNSGIGTATKGGSYNGEWLFNTIGDVYNNVDISLAWADLTTLFPTDPDFVDSLTADDSLKVIHRLGIFAFEHDLPDDYPI